MGTALRLFGTTTKGKRVEAITLHARGLTATILTYGAVLQCLRLDGIPYSLTLGSERLADYEGEMAYHGAIVGPVVNRLSRARAVVAGVEHMFEPNLNRKHTLHSGSAGTQSKVWQIDDVCENTVTLSHFMPDGEAGFPGNRHLTARFDLLAGPILRLTLTTTTDAPGFANTTNHSYWNLDGTDHLRDHTIRVAADSYLPSDAENFLVTGEVAELPDTPYDFQRPRSLVPGHPPLDTTFCVAQARRDLTECCWLRGASGVSMAVATTEPGLHLYDARAARRPHGPFYEGLAIEAQGWPDAPNNAGFPAIDITPDTPAVQITEWRFSKP